MDRISVNRPETISAAIRQWRIDAGLSQVELAHRLGTTQSAVSRWENGHDEPRLSTIAALLSACELVGDLVIGPDVDRAQIIQQLSLTPRQRLEGLANVSRLRASAVLGSA